MLNVSGAFRDGCCPTVPRFRAFRVASIPCSQRSTSARDRFECRATEREIRARCRNNHAKNTLVARYTRSYRTRITLIGGASPPEAVDKMSRAFGGLFPEHCTTRHDQYNEEPNDEGRTLTIEPQTKETQKTCYIEIPRPTSSIATAPHLKATKYKLKIIEIPNPIPSPPPLLFLLPERPSRIKVGEQHLHIPRAFSEDRHRKEGVDEVFRVVKEIREGVPLNHLPERHDPPQKEHT